MALVQEYIPARDGHITRVETLGGKYLYAINVFPDAGSFDLCPADACQTKDGADLARTATSACPVDAPRRGLRVEAVTPSPEVIGACERIAQAADIDVGGIESMIDDRDGQRVYYDINALSNFVADAPRVIGFDPHARLVDFLESEIGRVFLIVAAPTQRTMRYGYWLPIFGGWLRNVADEGMDGLVGLRPPTRLP